jgi:hypothetical protein
MVVPGLSSSSSLGHTTVDGLLRMSCVAFADTILLCQFDIGVDKDGDPVTILVYSRHIVLTALRVAEVSSVVVKHILNYSTWQAGHSGEDWIRTQDTPFL